MKPFYYIGIIAIFTGCNPEGTEIQESPQPSLSEKVEKLMVPVSGGTFIMGQTTAGIDESPDSPSRAESSAEDNNAPRPDELPLHEVSVSDFKISKYEVTQGLWKEVMGTIEPSYSASTFGESPNRAMDGVSWEDATAFISRLN